MVNEGINFSMQQLRSGIISFLPVLGLQISGFQDILESHNNSPEKSCEDMDNEEEVDPNFDSESDNDSDSDTDTDKENQSTSSCVLTCLKDHI